MSISMQDAPRYATEAEDATIAAALAILEKRVDRGDAVTSSASIQKYLRLRMAPLEHEEFWLVLLDNQHRVITTVPLFRGTIDGAAVYPREVVKTVLAHNAAAVILAHNHPSGLPEPSQADVQITGRLKKALDTIDVRTLDHIVIGAAGCVSFAERGML